MKKISVISCGDLAFADIQSKADFDYSKMVLKNVQNVLDSADVSLINLENPLTTSTSGIKKTGPCLYGEPKNVEFLKAGKFDLAILANNHTGDFGEQGVMDTINILEENNIMYAGAGKNIDEAYKPVYITKNDCTVGIVAVAENEFGGAADNKYGMAGFKLGRTAAAIKEAKANADFVLVVFHGGNEFNPLPSPRVKERYHLLCDLGADALIGMHTHCPQGYEIYNGKPIVYCTGNFWFRSHSTDTECGWYYGYMPMVTFYDDKAPEIELFPYHLVENFKELELLEGERKDKFLAYIKKISDIIADDKLLSDYFKGWCMISGPEYASSLKFDLEKFENKTITDEAHFCFMLNDFTCEAHNELMAGILKTAYENEYDFAKEMEKKLRELQKMP